MKHLATLAFCAALAAAQENPPKTPPPAGTIAGTVTASGSGAPMKDVVVSVAGGTPQAKRAVTDQQGRYHIRDVQPGPVRISANAPDSDGRPGGFGPSASRTVRLEPGQDMTGVNFQLVVFGTISGKVIDQNKEAVPGVTVFLVVREYSHGALRAVFAGAGTTDDQGFYEVQRVQPGRAYALLAVRMRRNLPALSESPTDPTLRLPSVFPIYYPNARSADGAETILLRPAERREGVDIQLTRGPAFCVDALLEGAAGPGAIRFNIAETQPASGTSGNGGFYTASPGGTSGSDGKVRICDLHPGDYELSVNDFKSGPLGGLVGFGSTIVTIGDRDIAGVRVGLRPKIPVAGEVVFDGPAPDRPLETKLRLDLQAITRTERGGVDAPIPGEFNFEGGLAMDEFGLTVSRVPAGFYVKDVTYGERSILNEPLRVGRAMGNAGLRIVLARDGGTVTSRVQDKDGNPVADGTVVVLPATAPSEAVFAAAVRIGRTDQSGSWTSSSLPPGKYYALALSQNVDRSPETIGKLWKARNRGEEVEIAPNGKTSVTLAPKPLD